MTMSEKNEEAGKQEAGDGQDNAVQFTQADLNAAASKTRKEAEAKTQQRMLDQLGVTNLSEVSAALQAAREREDAEKTAAERLAAAQAELEEARKTATSASDALSTYVQGQLEAELDAIPEASRALIPAEYGAQQQLDYIRTHRDLLGAASAKKESAGKAGSGGAFSGEDVPTAENYDQLRPIAQMRFRQEHPELAKQYEAGAHARRMAARRQS